MHENKLTGKLTAFSDVLLYIIFSNCLQLFVVYCKAAYYIGTTFAQAPGIRNQIK